MSKKRPMLDSDNEDFVTEKSILTKKARHKASSSSGSSSDGDDDNEWTAKSGSEQPQSDEGSDYSNSSSDDDLEFDDGLGEDLVRNEEDRQKLDSMTEAEREQEFFKRHEQREALKARFEIERILRMAKKKKHHQRKESRRQKRSLRMKQSKKTKTALAIDELRAKRSADKQKKAAEAERKNVDDEQVVRREPLRASEVFSSESESSDDDDDDDEKDDGSDDIDDEDESSSEEQGSKSLEQLKEANQPVSGIGELSKIKLSRFRLEKWVHMPFFSSVVIGCYVRIGIGQHEGRMVYRICEIVSVQETPKVYTLGGTKSNKGLRLKYGMQERVFRMEYVSNSAFTEGEFSKWKNEMESCGLSLPTLGFVKKKAAEIQDTKSSSLKDEDIDKIINEKKKFFKNPHNYALAKNRLIREKEIAMQLGRNDEVGSIKKKLEELEERAEELDRQRSKGLSAISYINERNRQRNVERAEEALKEEMASLKDKEDPFTRRKCMPRIVLVGKDSTELADLAGTNDGKESINLTTASTQLHNRSLEEDIVTLENQSSQIEENVSDSTLPQTSNQIHDLFSAHDFDISIDLPSNEQGQSVKSASKLMSTSRSEGPRRSLNLSDYKKRRGLI